ncbi:C-X-C motif chemokine 16 isoform X2 [Pteronotus mesoamericanus]|uniref:C-X-C motif chemokine 16 isoform X2 n=1 Tax=Pteronotus mesoamericanus TaxID=1884717 RepID=UPI0023EC845A|nr:C-X-C motif chemokine 16 isoform X2 [Pteronotus parnellii mesoamericanus]
MRGTWGPQFLALLLLLAMLILPGRGNEGSTTGSCRCDTPFYSHSPPTAQQMEHFRKQLKSYDQCTPLVRFRLPRRTVCGGSRDPWVITLIHCLDRKECGRAFLGRMAHQHSPPSSSQVPGSTERAPAVTSISAQTHLPPTLQSTQQHTLPAALPLDENLTHANETTTSAVGHSLETGENKQQLDGNVGPTAGTAVTVPVLSLLAISFLLTGVLLYVLCKRRSKKSPQYSPDLQLQYTRRLSDSQHMG